MAFGSSTPGGPQDFGGPSEQSSSSASAGTENQAGPDLSDFDFSEEDTVETQPVSEPKSPTGEDVFAARQASVVTEIDFDVTEINKSVGKDLSGREESKNVFDSIVDFAKNRISETVDKPGKALARATAGIIGGIPGLIGFELVDTLLDKDLKGEPATATKDDGTQDFGFGPEGGSGENQPAPVDIKPTATEPQVTEDEDDELLPIQQFIQAGFAGVQQGGFEFSKLPQFNLLDQPEQNKAFSGGAGQQPIIIADAATLEQFLQPVLGKENTDG